MYGKKIDKSNIFAGSFYVFVKWMHEQTNGDKSQSREKSQMNLDSNKYDDNNKKKIANGAMNMTIIFIISSQFVINCQWLRLMFKKKEDIKMKILTAV